MEECYLRTIWRIEVKWNNLAVASDTMDKAIFTDELPVMTKERVWTHYRLNTRGHLHYMHVIV
jgi:hypothetical protein